MPGYVRPSLRREERGHCDRFRFLRSKGQLLGVNEFRSFHVRTTHSPGQDVAAGPGALDARRLLGESQGGGAVLGVACARDRSVGQPHAYLPKPTKQRPFTEDEGKLSKRTQTKGDITTWHKKKTMHKREDEK